MKSKRQCRRHCLLLFAFAITKKEALAGLNPDAKEVTKVEKLTIRFANPLLLDRLRALAIEYSVSDELLLIAAAQRLLDDVDFLRNLRTGRMRSK